MRTVQYANEDALLERLLAGDEAAFSDLVAVLHGSLIRFARTFVSDGGAAEEVVQETWLGVLKGLRSFERRSSLKTWIFRIAMNRARTRGARDGRVVNFSALSQSDEQTSALPDRFTAEGRWLQPPSRWHAQTPEDLLLRREAVTGLREAIANLPPDQRAVIRLRDMDGVGAPEVCDILGISETNQRVLLHRARRRIRAALDSHLHAAAPLPSGVVAWNRHA